MKRELRNYHVKIGAVTLAVLAFTCCDAITIAIDHHLTGEDPLPVEGLSISAKLA